MEKATSQELYAFEGYETNCCGIEVVFKPFFLGKKGIPKSFKRVGDAFLFIAASFILGNSYKLEICQLLYNSEKGILSCYFGYNEMRLGTNLKMNKFSEHFYLAEPCFFGIRPIKISFLSCEKIKALIDEKVEAGEQICYAYLDESPTGEVFTNIEID